MDRRLLMAGLLIAGWTALGGGMAVAAENLVKNPGFELSQPVNVDRDMKEFVSRGVDLLKGTAVPMPAGWSLNVSDGWSKEGKDLFRYVAGEAGKEVHSGTHAIRIGSGVHAVVYVESMATVVPEAGANKNVLLLNKPNKFSFWAKGKGQVMIYAYTYLAEGENYSARTVTPAMFNTTDDWQKYDGAIEFTNPKVVSSRIVVCISQGDVTIDDVAWYGQD